MHINEQQMRHEAAEEIERDLRRKFFEERKFFWWKFPLPDRKLEVLIAASKSIANGACKGGLINERGQPDKCMSQHVRALCREGYLGEYGTFREFEPTLLGWAMLDAFAKDRACFPEQVQRSLRQFYDGTPSCTDQDSPTSTNSNGDQQSPSSASPDAAVQTFPPTIR